MFIIIIRHYLNIVDVIFNVIFAFDINLAVCNPERQS